MKTFFLLVGVAMSLVSARFALDASNHMPAAVTAAGFAIGAGLCFVASAVVRRHNAPPNHALQRTWPVATRLRESRLISAGRSAELGR
jgi:hypothetical protein